MIFGTPPHTRRFADSEIADICGVSIDTAYRWRSGRQAMPTSARKLLDLTAAGRILPESWQGAHVDQDGQLHTDTGYQLSIGEIEQFGMMMQFWRATETHNRRLMEYIDYLENVTPRAPVIRLDRTKMRPSLTNDLNPLFWKD